MTWTHTTCKLSLKKPLPDPAKATLVRVKGTSCFLPDRVVAKTPLGGAVLEITSLKVEPVVRQAAAN